MAPRKSNISQISATDPEGGGTPLKDRDGINIEVQAPLHPASPSALMAPGLPNPAADSNSQYPQDLSLPKTMVQRLAKGVLPPNTSLGKDAIVAMQKGATVFINYLAQAANTSTTNANKRTIPPPAVLEALVDLEFEAFVPRVEAELNRYNEVQVGKRNEYRRKVKEEKMGGVKGGSGDEVEEEEGRAAKRVRREEGGDGHEQLLVGEGEEGEGEEEDGDGDGDGGVEVEGGEDGEEEEEDREEEEDDDEDEYPDEGRRLSSVEREAHEGVEGGRSPRYDETNGEEGDDDEEGLSGVSD